jgi:hypothetical protein
MPIHVELPVHTVADLTVVELRLRELQRASTGVPCQALLTTEYLFWRHEVTKQLQGTGAEPLRCVEAFIQGFYLLYERNTCSVSQTLPSVVQLDRRFDTHHAKLRKRKAPSPETISGSLDI